MVAAHWITRRASIGVVPLTRIAAVVVIAKLFGLPMDLEVNVSNDGRDAKTLLMAVVMD